jgi:hypothetical protein
MFVPAREKQEAVSRIAQEMGVPDRRCSIGSTEPKEIFLDVIRGYGLLIDERIRKPELAEAIAHAAGLRWDDQCDSRNTPSGGGDTVTLTGLNRVLEAVTILRERRRT